MLPAPLRKAGYAFVAVYGLFATLAPRLASSLGVRMGLLGFDNTAELEAEDWYVRAVRSAGVGMLAAGGVGLLLEDRAGQEGDESEVDATTDDVTDEADAEDDGPVDIDIDA
jgi:hypothetical protein